MTRIWFHGTTEDKAKDILSSGFRSGTYFARHLEDALEYGGPCVLFVKIHFKCRKWQVVCSNKISRDFIVKVVTYNKLEWQMEREVKG